MCNFINVKLAVIKLILPPLLQSVCYVFLVYQGKLFKKKRERERKYQGFVHKRDSSVKTHSSTFPVLMASGVL